MRLHIVANIYIKLISAQMSQYDIFPPSLLFPFFLRDSITIGIILIRESPSSAIFTAKSLRLELRSSILLISPMKIILSLRESIRPLSFVVLLYTVIPTMLTVACLHAIRDVTSQC